MQLIWVDCISSSSRLFRLEKNSLKVISSVLPRFSRRGLVKKNNKTSLLLYQTWVIDHLWLMSICPQRLPFWTFEQRPPANYDHYFSVSRIVIAHIFDCVNFVTKCVFYYNEIHLFFSLINIMSKLMWSSFDNPNKSLVNSSVNVIHFGLSRSDHIKL